MTATDNDKIGTGMRDLTQAAGYKVNQRKDTGMNSVNFDTDDEQKTLFPVKVVVRKGHWGDDFTRNHRLLSSSCN